MDTHFMFILPDYCLVCATVFILTGSISLTLFVSAILVVAIHFFKLPKSPNSSSDAIFVSDASPVIAHKGGAEDAPENTLSAIRLASKNGATAIEFDVDLTSDGHVIVIHDDTVDRTTDGTGSVNTMNFDEIRALNASAKYPNNKEFPNEQIPTLEEVACLCMKLNLKMYIDVKKSCPLMAKKICELYQKYPKLYNLAAVCSFYPPVVYMVKKADSKIVTGLTHRRGILACEHDGSFRKEPFWKLGILVIGDVLLKWAIYHWLWYICGTSVFLMWNKDASLNTIEDLQKRDLHVVLWTVNDPIEKEYLAKVVHVAYMTDTLK